ncbi:MAG: hypothetical protein ACQES2_00715 [Pseudomonadota bacterium]
MSIRERFTLSADDRTGRGTKSARKNFMGVDDSVHRLRSSVLALAGAGGFGYMIKRQIDAGAAMSDYNDRVGVTAEAQSQYRYVAEQTGVGNKTLETSFQRLQRRVAEAAQGTGEAKDAIKELGLSAEDLNKLSPDQQFEAIAAAMQQVENQGDKTLLAMKLFDTEGVALLQTMKGGSEAIQALKDEADALGLTMSGETASGMKAFSDDLDRMKGQAEAFARQLTTNMLPAAQAVTQYLTTDGRAAFGQWALVVGQVGSELDSTSASMDAAAYTASQTGSTILGAFENLPANLKAFVEIAATELFSFFDKVKAGSELLSDSLKAIFTDDTIEASVERFNQKLDASNQARRAGIEDALKQRDATIAASEAEREQLEKTFSKRQEILDRLKAQQEAGGGSLGGAASSEKEKEKRAEAQEEARENLREFLLSKLEIEKEAHQQRLEWLAEANYSEAEMEAAKTKLVAFHAKRRREIEEENLTALEEFKRKSFKNQSKQVLGELEGLTRGVAQNSRTMFEINKAAGKGMAVINTWQGVSESLANYPWPLAGVMAAAHLKAGKETWAGVSGASFGGGGAAPSLSTGGGGAGAPINTTSIDPISTAANDDDSPRTRRESQKFSDITIMGPVYGFDDFEEKVTEAVGRAADRDSILIRSNSAQAQELRNG